MMTVRSGEPRVMWTQATLFAFGCAGEFLDYVYFWRFRNLFLEKLGYVLPKAVKTGTTIAGIVFEVCVHYVMRALSLRYVSLVLCGHCL